MRKKKDTHSFDFRPLGLAIREACLPEEEQKTLLEQRMTVLQEYLAGIQKQDTEEWEKQVNPYHVANLQRMTDIVLAEIMVPKGF